MVIFVHINVINTSNAYEKVGHILYELYLPIMLSYPNRIGENDTMLPSYHVESLKDCYSFLGCFPYLKK
jgi:hypothetical protein